MFFVFFLLRCLCSAAQLYFDWVQFIFFYELDVNVAADRCILCLGLHISVIQCNFTSILNAASILILSYRRPARETMRAESGTMLFIPFHVPQISQYALCRGFTLT